MNSLLDDADFVTVTFPLASSLSKSIISLPFIAVVGDCCCDALTAKRLPNGTVGIN